MTLEIRDIIYFLMYVSSILSLYYSFRNRLKTLEDNIARSQKILFGDRGLLNLIDTETCKCYRDQIFVAIRRGETATEMMLNKIEALSRNVLIIMVHMNINTPDCMPKNDKKTDKK